MSSKLRGEGLIGVMVIAKERESFPVEEYVLGSGTKFTNVEDAVKQRMKSSKISVSLKFPNQCPNL